VSDIDKVGTAADPEALRLERTRLDGLLKQRREDLQRVMALPEGRRFVWRILTACGSFQRLNMPLPEKEANWFLGRRNLGLDLIDELIRDDQPFYLLMEQECRSQEMA
jgi:hypothetical protein